MIALRCYQGRSAVKLLDADESLGAILLERLDPGTTLRQYLNRQSESWRVRKDHPSIRAAIMLITDLPVLDMEATPEEGLPTYAQWMGKSFAEFRHKNKHDVEYLGWLLAAEEAFGLLDASRGETCLLHGDLHHENILLDQQRGWVAIDPKGVIGPKILECGRFLHNFLHDETDDAVTGAGYLEQLCDILSARYLALSEILGYKLIDLARVAFIDVTLSTSWTMNGFSSSGSWSRKRGVQLVRATYLALLELETNSGKLKR
jgi:streptomycin 6-kinase